MTDTPTDTLTVPLTEDFPVSINLAEWPIVGSADWCDNKPNPSNRDILIVVRAKVTQDDDAPGQSWLVHGKLDTCFPNEPNLNSGYLLHSAEEVPESIAQVAQELTDPITCQGADEIRQVLVNECLSSLPPRQI